MAALLTTDFNIPNDIATGIFEKAQKGSTLAQLSGARPQKFGTQQVWVLTSAPKAELVGEAVQKSPTPAAYSSKTITPLKLQVTMRFSQEVKWADEDTQIGVLQDLSTNAGIALGRALKSKFKTAITTVKGLDWKGTGTNVVSGILNGMYNWGSKLKSWASSLLSKAQSALGIASPSTLFRDEVGLFLGLGVAEGLEDSSGSVMDTVQSLASGVAEGLSNIDTGVSLSAATVGLDSTLDSFAETVTEGFSALIIDLRGLLEQAAALAPGLSGVTISDVTSQAETLGRSRSYDASGIDESWMDSLADRVAQRVSAQSGSTGGGEVTVTVPVYLDGKLVGQSAVTYINGEARRTGVNPLAAYL